MFNAFMPHSSCATVFSANGTSVSAQLPTAGKCIRVLNKGAASVYVEFGGSTVVASADNSYPVLRSSVAELFRSENQTHVAVCTEGGEFSIAHVVVGEKI